LSKKIIYFFRLESGTGYRFDVEFDRPPADGGLLATSACPILGRMRPPAHMHLPFAIGTENVHRAVSMHLMGQFLRGEHAG